MHRCSPGSVLTLALAILLLATLTGCLGKSTNTGANGGVESVALSPGEPISIDVGTTQVFSASGKDANGHPVLGLNIQYIVGVPEGATGPAPLSIASNGNACAGSWDSTDAICNPGTPGVATVTAVIEGVSSPATFVYVHQHVDNIAIQNFNGQPPQYDCFSQGQTWQYEGFAYSNGVDISNTVGPMSWTSSTAGVATLAPSLTGPIGSQVNLATATAAVPGVTQLYATVAGTTSSPFPFTTCLVKAIYLQISSEGQAGNSLTVPVASSVSITATAVDTLFGISNSTPLAKPPLTWSTTNPEVAAFSTLTNTTGANTATTRANSGGATVFASCAPPSCNAGVFPGLPVYASIGKLPNGTAGYDTISLDVTPNTSGVPKYGAWSTTNQCDNQPGCGSALFALAPSEINPISTILQLPRTPNSMMFNYQATSVVYLGSNQGLMYVDVGNNSKVNEVSTSPTPCNLSVCGTVLTISNDGKQVVVSDTVSNPSQVYIYNSGAAVGVAPIDLVIPGQTATAAAFSPDQMKIFILTSTGNLYVYSTVDALSSVPIATSVTDVKYSVDGSFVYVAGTPGPASISGFANCNTPTTPVLTGVTTLNGAVPTALFPSPTLQLDSLGNWTETVLVLNPPYIDSFGVNVTQNPLTLGQFACTPPTVTLDLDFPRTSFNLGEGKFVPVYSALVADGTQMIVVAQNIPAVLVFDVANGTTTAVRLVGNAAPLAASASTDGSQVYVAACDQYQGSTCIAGSIHIINTVSQGDIQQVPYIDVNQNNNMNMCNGQGAGAPLCLPNMVAIKPQ
jgi:hypothetical protein